MATKKETYTEAMKRLEAIVARIEGNELDIDELGDNLIVGINCIKQMLKSKRCSMRVIKWKKAVIKLDFANINFTFA